ncbi:MAG: hypothetical protein ACLTTH_09770 [Holdemanella porci]
MKQIVQFIEDNNISEEVVAKAAHMSLRNFRRQIHSEDRTQTRIVLILADYNHQSIDSIFFDQMYNQPVNLEGLTWNQVQDIMKLIHPELFTDIKRSSKFKDFEYNLKMIWVIVCVLYEKLFFRFHKLNLANIWK